MKKLTRNLLFVAGLLLSGGISTMATAQSQTPASSDVAPAQQQSRAQELMGATAPKLAELTDSVLYADIWERPQLSKRDRSLVTVAALIVLNRPDQLRSHLNLARQNGVTERGAGRDHYPHGLLLGLAERGIGRRHRQGSVSEVRASLRGDPPERGLPPLGKSMKPSFLALIFLTAAMPAYEIEIVVTRVGSQPSSAGPSENFTGSVRVDSASREAVRPGSAAGP